MTQWKKSLAVLALCVLTVCGAAAERQPDADLPTAGRAEIALCFEQLSGFSAAGVDALNRFFAGGALTLQWRLGQDAADGALILPGQKDDAWRLAWRETGSGIAAALPSGLVNGDAVPLLPLLPAVPRLHLLPQAYADSAADVYAALETQTTGEKKKTATSIKNTQASASQTVYTLSAKQMNAAWPAGYAAMENIPDALWAHRPAVKERWRNALSSIKFSGSSTVKRFFARDGGDMGLQFTGTAKILGVRRKITLFAGYTAGKGGYLSLAMPGEGSPWKFQLAVRETGSAGKKQTLAIEGSFQRMEGDDLSDTGFSGTWTADPKHNKVRGSGAFTLTTTAGKQKTVWTLSPTVSAKDHKMTVDVDCTRNGSTALKARAKIDLQEETEPVFPNQPAASSVADGQEAWAAEGKRLVRALAPAIEEMNQQERDALSRFLHADVPKATLKDVSAPLDVPDGDTLTLTLGGDAALGTRETLWRKGKAFPAYIKTRGLSWPFSGLQSCFAGDDMTLVNLEGVLKSNGKGEQKYKSVRIRGLPAWAEALKLGSVEQVNIANNHHEDYGASGSRSTLKALEEQGIAYSGFGQSYVWEKNGHKIGFAGVRQAVFRKDPEQVAAQMKQQGEDLRAQGCQVIIFSCHWGEEYNPYHTDLQWRMARAAVDAGADVIVGTHPHVVQGIGCIGHTPVIWSLGNLCFGATQEMKTFDGTLMRLTLVFDENGYAGCRLRAVPILTSSRYAEDVNDFHPIPAKGKDAQRILALIQQDSTVRLCDDMWFPVKEK